MPKLRMSVLCKSFALLLFVQLYSCQKFKDYSQPPEIESLQQGLKTSVVIGYCVSVANSAFKGLPLPSNVAFDESKGLIYIKIDQAHPLPFNKSIGDIVIACHWGTNGGIMSILLANIDILGGQAKLYGLLTVPFIERNPGEGILAVFARQDIILGNGSDTLVDFSTVTGLNIDAEMSRLESEKPGDAFVAIKQNVWFITVYPRTPDSNVYNDYMIVSGGGQIAEVKGVSGGVVYHALIDAKVDFSACTRNPIDGFALSQNFKAGGAPYIDFGNSFLSFRNTCDGKAHVEFSTGKYVSYNGRDIALNLN